MLYDAWKVKITFTGRCEQERGITATHTNDCCLSAALKAELLFRLKSMISSIEVEMKESVSSRDSMKKLLD